MESLSQIFTHFAQKRVLIIGATGFVGRHLVYHLLNAGAFLTIYSRSVEKARTMLAVVNTQNHPVNILSTLPAMPFDYIFNLAGEGIADQRWSEERRRVLIQSRVDWTRELVQWMYAHPPKTLINASAIGYYGVRAEQILIEKDHPVQEFMSQLCLEWEKAADLAQNLGVQVIKTRFGVIFGERGALSQIVKPFFYGLGGKIGHGKQFVSWVDINDVIAALGFITRTQKNSAVYNITAPNPVPQQELAYQIAKILKVPCFFTTPRWVLELMFGEMSKLITCGQRVLPRALLDAGFSFQYPHVQNSLEHVCRMTNGFKEWNH